MRRPETPSPSWAMRPRYLLLWAVLATSESAVAPLAPPAASPAAPRLDAVDWLRGVAVVLMIQAHGFDAWLDPAARVGFAWAVIRHLSGLPSRLFLLLVGVAIAIRFDKQIARGVST